MRWNFREGPKFVLTCGDQSEQIQSSRTSQDDVLNCSRFWKWTPWTQRGHNMFTVWDFSLALEEQITHGITQAHNKETFSVSSWWIKCFAETSVACWGHYPFFFFLSLSLPLHPGPTTFLEWPVFWVCFWSIYIASYVSKPLINITAVPDFSRKPSMQQLPRETSVGLKEHKNNLKIGKNEGLFYSPGLNFENERQIRKMPLSDLCLNVMKWKWSDSTVNCFSQRWEHEEMTLCDSFGVHHSWDKASEMRSTAALFTHKQKRIWVLKWCVWVRRAPQATLTGLKQAFINMSDKTHLLCFYTLLAINTATNTTSNTVVILQQWFLT